MQSFKLGDTEFGIGEVIFRKEDKQVTLEVTGSAEAFERMSEDEDSEWSWALYAPKLYVHEVPYAKELFIDGDLLDEYDIALYMMEHHDVIGSLQFEEDSVHFTGKSEIMGKVYPLVIHASLPDEGK